jgi:hypothetical protein
LTLQLVLLTMSSPAEMPPGFTPWQNTQPQPPPMAPNNGGNEDGVSVRPMRRMFYRLI